MSVESALAFELLNDPDVIAVVSDRVYPVLAPEKPVPPLLVYGRVSAPLEITMQGKRDLQTAHFRMTSAAPVYSDVVRVDNAMRAALRKCAGDGSVEIFGCFMDQPDDQYALESNMYIRTTDLDVQFR